MTDVKSTLVKFQSIIALIVLCIVLTLLSDKFFTMENGWNIARQISINVCISVGMTLVILTRGIDLSVGSMLALSGAVAAGLLKYGLEIPSMNTYIGFTVFGAILAGLTVGADWEYLTAG